KINLNEKTFDLINIEIMTKGSHKNIILNNCTISKIIDVISTTSPHVQVFTSYQSCLILNVKLLNSNNSSISYSIKDLLDDYHDCEMKFNNTLKNIMTIYHISDIVYDTIYIEYFNGGRKIKQLPL